VGKRVTVQLYVPGVGDTLRVVMPSMDSASSQPCRVMLECRQDFAGTSIFVSLAEDSFPHVYTVTIYDLSKEAKVVWTVGDNMMTRLVKQSTREALLVSTHGLLRFGAVGLDSSLGFQSSAQFGALSEAPSFKRRNLGREILPLDLQGRLDTEAIEQALVPVCGMAAGPTTEFTAPGHPFASGDVVVLAGMRCEDTELLHRPEGHRVLAASVETFTIAFDSQACKIEDCEGTAKTEAEAALLSHMMQLETYVPVLRVPLSDSGEPGNILVYSCCRYVMSAEACASRPSSESLDSVPVLRISLWKRCENNDMRLVLENLSERVTRELNFKDKCTDQPLGCYGELCQLGELNCLVSFAFDCKPRSARVALLVPDVGFRFQMVVLDSSEAPVSRPTTAASRPGTAALAMPARSQSRLQLARYFAVIFQLRLAAAVASETLDGQEKKQVREETLLHRGPIRGEDGCRGVLSAFAYATEDGHVRFRLQMYNPATRKDVHLVVVDPGLRSLLRECGLGRYASPADVDANKEFITSKLLARVTVSGGDIDFFPGEDIAALAQDDEVEKRAEERAATMRPPKTPQSRSPEDLECDAGALLESYGEGLEGDEKARLAVDGILKIEVFGKTTARDVVMYSTNFRVRVSRALGSEIVQDFHEDDLVDWLREGQCEHLLGASREPDLAHAVSRAIQLGPKGMLVLAPMVSGYDARYQRSVFGLGEGPPPG